MSIRDFDEKGNTETIYYQEGGGVAPRYRGLYLAIIIILISTLSFGLGRISSEGSKPGVKIEYDPEISNTQFPVSNQARVSNASMNIANSLEIENSDQSVVGSKNGTKYHFSHCSGAKLIKESNKVIFASPAAAEAAGYSLAGNCRPN